MATTYQMRVKFSPESLNPGKSFTIEGGDPDLLERIVDHVEWFDGELEREGPELIDGEGS